METAVVILITFLLVGGLVKLWFWSNNQIVRRQKNYNATRTAAGQSGLETFLYVPQWPAVENPAYRDERIEGDYNPFFPGINSPAN